jgi:hypothetical protein
LAHATDSEEELNQNDKYDKLSVPVWPDGDSSDDGAMGDINNLES